MLILLGPVRVSASLPLLPSTALHPPQTGSWEEASQQQLQVWKRHSVLTACDTAQEPH